MSKTPHKPRNPILVAFFLVLAAGLLYFLYLSFSYQWIFIALTVGVIYWGIFFIITDLEHQKTEAPAPKVWPSVSVIIPCHNEAKTVERTARACLALEYPWPVEVIVVDDGSKDDTAEIAGKIAGVRLIRKENGGKASALNRGIKVATGELVACVDADSFPQPDALRKLVKTLLRDDRIGAATGFITVNEPRNFLQQLQQVEYLWNFGFMLKTQSFVDGMMVTPGPMSLYRRKLLVELGGFEEGNMTEDMEIALRIKNHGYMIDFCPQARISTVAPRTVDAWLKQRVRWYRGRLVNLRKYKHMLFNPKFKDFGMFIFPITFILEVCSIAMLALIILINIMQWAGNLAWINAGMVPPFALPTSVTALASSWYFMLIPISIWLIIIYLSFRGAQERFGTEYFIGLVCFMLFYSFFLSLAYFISYFKELNRSSHKW